MQKLLRLNNVGTKGLNSDVQPWELPPEFITEGRNYRVFAGALRTAGGGQLWSTAPVNFNPGYLIHVPTPSSNFWLVAGRSAVYAFDGSNWSDISSLAGYVGIGVDQELLWTGCSMGQIPILNNPQHFPEYWSPQQAGQILQPLAWDASNTWADVNVACEVMRGHKTYLFALNVTEGATEFPDSFRWSHPADINGLPPSWDETDPAFLAGKASLGGDGGRIIDGGSLRNSFAIYSEKAVDILDERGDDLVWRRRELSSTVGLLTRNAIVEVQGAHFFLGDGDILRNDGNSLVSIVHDRIRRRLNAEINAEFFDRSFAVRNTNLKEVWFCVPESGSTTPNVAYVYNWRDDSWAIRDLVPGTSYANYGGQSTPDDSWGGLSVALTWDNVQRPWGSALLTPLDDTVVGCKSGDGTLHFQDPRDVPDDDVKTRVVRTDFPLEGHRQVTTISRVYPKIEGTEPVRIQMGSQDRAGAPVRWKPPLTFNPGQDRKLDVRTTGELHAWAIESIGKGNWIMSGMDIEYTPNGAR